MKQHLAKLNPEQHRAVTTVEGPLLVLAGAGTGKTRVITVRIAHLLAGGIAPEGVLAMTFTNKAAAEMRQRVAELVGAEVAGKLTVGTFHAFCLKLLREHQKALGYPKGIAIADAADQLTACKSVLRELRVPDATIRPATLQSRISLLKNRLVSPATFRETPGDEQDQLVGLAYERYEEFLRRSRKLDFDDLLLFALELLKENDGVRKELQARYRYVMVDEYQDTNGPQYEIVRALCARRRNLCVVGDDDQSIYSWRGADSTKILNFERDYPETAKVRLETNYRSTQEILNAANRVIVNNPQRHEKELWSAAGSGELVQVASHEDETREAEHVVNEIRTRVERGKNRLSDFAILFRTATQPRTFEAELRARGVPYVLIGGMSFFDRKEVRDVLAYLKVIANPQDEVSFLRIVNCPPRGVGKTTIDRVISYATDHGLSVPDAFDHVTEVDKVGAAAVTAVQRLRERLKALSRKRPGKQLVAFISEVVETFAYKSEVERCYPDPQIREQRWLGVQELLNFAENHVRRKARPGLGTFLAELTLSADDKDKDEAAKENSVTLMTLHSAKGLEFERVHLVGLEEGILPHAKSVAQDSIEEERRLMYVGVTRAMRGLTLNYTRERAKYGQRSAVHASRFLYEMSGKEPPAGWLPSGAHLQPQSGPPGKRRKSAKKKRRRKAARRG